MRPAAAANLPSAHDLQCVTPATSFMYPCGHSTHAHAPHATHAASAALTPEGSPVATSHVAPSPQPPPSPAPRNWTAPGWAPLERRPHAVSTGSAVAGVQHPSSGKKLPAGQ